MPTTHRLKTWRESFQAILDGEKRFEVRKNDRSFLEGDFLMLVEFDPCETCHATGCVNSQSGAIETCPECKGEKGRPTGRQLRCEVTYAIYGPISDGIAAGYTVMSIRLLGDRLEKRGEPRE